MSKKILYVGNNLRKHTNYVTAMETLGTLLSTEGYTVYMTSDKKNKLLRLFDMVYSFFKYQRKVDYILIDTFSTVSFYFSFTISQLARIFSKKYIPILHGGNLPHRIENSQFLSKLIFKNSCKNIAPSHYLKEAFEEKGYQVEFIPNVLEIDHYEFKLREELQPKLLWVRAFKQIYNPLLAIEVLKGLKEEYPQASLCMIGPVKDNSLEQVKQKVAEYGLEQDVEITGVLSREAWHQKSKEFDVFINTTNFDNTPVSVMEAMALGLPIVSTNVGGMPFLVENGVYGILVEKEDPEAMIQAIGKILTADAGEMTKKAREKAESFAWKSVKKKWFEILES